MKSLSSLLRGALAAVSLLLVAATLQAQTVTYFHNDLSGSPVMATDAAGLLLWKENYRPYGSKYNNSASSNANSIGFAGRPHDASSGLSYMDARYYDPVLGRFLGVDPAALNTNSVHGLNRYTYANNNPVRYVDPDGHSPLDVAFLIWDLGKLGAAVYSGNPAAIVEAAGDVAMSVVGVASPIPFAGEAIKAARAAEHAVEAVRGAEAAVEVGRAAKEGAGAYNRYKPGANFSKRTKSDIAEQAGNKCEYCGVETVAAKKSERGVTPPRNEAQTDHITPRSDGGTNAPSNAAHACRGCNRDLSNMPKSSPRQE